MKKRILGLLFCLLSLPSLATTTVSGHLSTLGTGNSTSSNNAFVRFKLIGCRGNQPRITGTGAIAPIQGKDNIFYVDLAADSSGNVSGTIYSTRDAAGTGNGEIECGGSYTGVYYNMEVCANGVCGPDVPITAKSTATIDPSSVTPNSVQPVVTAPTGDGTYLRLDAGNSPVTGAVTLGAAVTANSSVKPNADNANALGDSTHRWTASLGTTTAKNLGGVRYADQFTGTDIGAQINAAYADCPSTGCIVVVPASATPYTFTTAISATTAGKPLTIQCSPGGATVLSWGSTTGTAITLDTRLNTNQHPTGQGIYNCVLTTSGAVSSTGILLGATNSAEGYVLEGVKVENFTHNITIATANTTGSWRNTFINVVSRTAGSDCYNTSGTIGAELIKIVDGAILNCPTGIVSAGGSTDWEISGTSCDDPGAGGCIGNAGVVTWTGGHFENPGSGAPLYVNSNGIVAIYGGVALDDVAVGTNSTSWFQNTGTDSLVIDGMEISTAGRSMATNPVVSFGANGRGALRIYNHVPASLTPLYSANAFQFNKITDMSFDSAGGMLAAIPGPVKLLEGSAPSGVAATNVCYGDSTAHALKCSFNNDTFSQVSRFVDSGPTYNSAGTKQSSPHSVKDSCTLGTNCSITLTGAAVFTSNTSYDCWTRDATTPANAVTVTRTSGSAVAFAGTGTDVINYFCWGN